MNKKFIKSLYKTAVEEGKNIYSDLYEKVYGYIIKSIRNRDNYNLKLLEEGNEIFVVKIR